ncbi:hypothetical protein P9112_005600 [Eukaryota sp. TZLM1-RC]
MKLLDFLKLIAKDYGVFCVLFFTNDEINDMKNNSEWNSIADIQHMTPEELNLFYSSFFEFNRPFTKIGYKFNNTIKTDGFAACIELAREDGLGMSFKIDSAKFATTGNYLDDLDVAFLSSKHKVHIDPGKSDLFYLCSQKRFKLNAKVQLKRDKQYEWLRLTTLEWPRVSRVHQKLRKLKKKAFILQNGITVEQTETVSKESSKSSIYNIFYSNVASKLINMTFTFDYYCLMIWQDIRYVHHQKKEAKLLKRMAEKQWKQEDTILMFDDNGNKTKNSKHHRSSRGVGWTNFFKRNGYTVCSVDERNTSSKCAACYNPVNVFLDVENSRPWMREKYPTVKCHALLRCRSEVCREECDGKD